MRAPESAGARQLEPLMNLRYLLAVAVIGLTTQVASAANTLPLSNEWHISPSGTAASSGELLFRVTSADGEDATEVTVFVLSGSNETGVASSIRRALNTQLRADRFNVQPGEGANILLSASPPDNFSLELIDSDVENVRVVVQSAAPVAPPTVPRQATPVNPAQPSTPPAPGDAIPPPPAAPPENASQPAAPPPSNSPPLPNGAPPPNAPGGDGASAPPPNASPGNGPASAPPPTN
jgi:hypothetical protein